MKKYIAVLITGFLAISSASATCTTRTKTVSATTQAQTSALAQTAALQRVKAACSGTLTNVKRSILSRSGAGIWTARATGQCKEQVCTNNNGGGAKRK